MTLRYLDWIWNVRGSLPLASGQSADDAFRRLSPLFDQDGTSHQWSDTTLTFTKKDQAAQDRMSVFDNGVLKVEQAAGGSVLRYRLVSRTLLFCFLLPLLFLGFAQLTVVQNHFSGPPDPKAAAASKKLAEKKASLPMNPLDKALGAPAPDKPKKDDKKEKAGDDDKPSPTAGYVFAALFALLYVVGRVLEDRLVRKLFRRQLAAG